jgi:hypothetical protein
MSATMRAMPLFYSELHKLLDEYGVHTIRQLCADTGLSSQQGWNLWHGKVGVGRKTALLLASAEAPTEARAHQRRSLVRAEGARCRRASPLLGAQSSPSKSLAMCWISW